jgi:DNA-3-methyladenine glycosylase I
VTTKHGLLLGNDGLTRCWWPKEDAGYLRYHDQEWGRPVRDDHRLFEKLCLEGFQSGLSWLTILRKREAFREAFAGFDFEKVARFDRRKAERLMKDAGIVRHRGKIESTINNAKRACELVDAEGSLAKFFWSFEPKPTTRPKKLTHATLLAMTHSAESIALSKELRRRGFSFVGPTTAYAFMQAMGLVNDHLEGCAIRSKVETARRRFSPPRP